MTDEEREWMRALMQSMERQSFAAKLQDLGEDDCGVCHANRIRESWDADEHSEPAV